MFLAGLIALMLAPTGGAMDREAASARPETPRTLAEAVSAVAARPEFRHASFGMEVYSLDLGRPLFDLNADKLFTPGSTTKLLTEGTALKLLGADYRFHTPVYRTGPIDPDGTLRGDLVIVASGDPNLSDRLQPNGALAFADEDHSYGGPKSRLIPGDPLVVLREFARQIAAAGVKRVTGRVLVDVSLFPEGARELGTGVVISPIAVNDNLIDLTITPGAAVGAPARVAVSPVTPHIRFENQITTMAGAEIKEGRPEILDAPDGGRAIVLRGAIGVASGPAVYGYPVESPSRFAAEALTLALNDLGIVVDGKGGAVTDVAAAKGFYLPEYRVAEHVSAPLAEEIKVTLKVSQNLHASMTPYILGAVVGKATADIDAKGFMLERQLLTKAGLDLSGASQSDGAGGAQGAFYTPDFMTHYLAFMAAQPDFEVFRRALPVLGRDGTLADIQPGSPGAGHVFAKTGTFGAIDLLNGRTILTGKGLAGYTTTPAGAHLAFAIYVNRVELQDGRNVSDLAGQALGEIASAIYALPIDRPGLDPPP